MIVHLLCKICFPKNSWEPCLEQYFFQRNFSSTEDAYLPGRWLSSWQMPVYLADACLPGRYLSTWQMTVYLADACLPGRCLSTWQMPVYLGDDCLPGRCLSTWQMPVYLADACLPSLSLLKLQVQLFLKVHHVQPWDRRLGSVKNWKFVCFITKKTGKKWV